MDLKSMRKLRKRDMGPEIKRRRILFLNRAVNMNCQKYRNRRPNSLQYPREIVEILKETGRWLNVIKDCLVHGPQK